MVGRARDGRGPGAGQSLRGRGPGAGPVRLQVRAGLI